MIIFVDKQNRCGGFCKFCLVEHSPAILRLLQTAFRRVCLRLVVYTHSSHVLCWMADKLNSFQALSIQSHLKEKGGKSPTQTYTISGYIIFVSSWYCQLLIGR